MYELHFNSNTADNAVTGMQWKSWVRMESGYIYDEYSPYGDLIEEEAEGDDDEAEVDENNQ